MRRIGKLQLVLRWWHLLPRRKKQPPKSGWKKAHPGDGCGRWKSLQIICKWRFCTLCWGLCYISHGGGWYVVWTRGWRHSINMHQHLVNFFFWRGCCIIATSINIYSARFSPVSTILQFRNLGRSFLGRDTARWSARSLGFGGDLEERLQQIANGSEPISHYEAWQIGPDHLCDLYWQ